MFANGPGDLGSIPGRVIPKTLKMVLDTTLLNTQHYKVFKGKVEQSWEWSSALHLGVVAIEKGAFGSPSTMVANFTYLLETIELCANSLKNNVTYKLFPYKSYTHTHTHTHNKNIYIYIYIYIYIARIILMIQLVKPK